MQYINTHKYTKTEPEAITATNLPITQLKLYCSVLSCEIKFVCWLWWHSANTLSCGWRKRTVGSPQNMRFVHSFCMNEKQTVNPLKQCAFTFRDDDHFENWSHLDFSGRKAIFVAIAWQQCKRLDAIFFSQNPKNHLEY